MASLPHASARRTRLATRSSSRLQYSWYQWPAPPSSAATSSIGTDAWVLRIGVTCCSTAARATARSASSWAADSTPIGATSSGDACRRPNSSTPRSRSLVSTSIRGTTRQRSKAARLAVAVASPPADPAT